jgi:predicted PurR-regulated permease PerM
MAQELNFNISWGTISKIALAAIALYFLYLVRDMVILFLFSFIVSVLFNFPIDNLEKKRIPRAITAPLLYFSVFFLISFFLYQTAPIFINEIQSFTQKIPYYFQEISPILSHLGVQAAENTESLTTVLKGWLEGASKNILNALFSLFGGASSSIFVISLAFFISLERDLAGRILTLFLSPQYDRQISYLLSRAKKKIASWFISRLIGVLFVWGGCYILLTVLDVRYAFILSLFAGLMDIIPILGPFFASIVIGILIALLSVFQATFFFIGFIIIQFLQDNLILPLIFKRFMGIPPAVVLMAIPIGFRLWGVIGAILVIPLAGIIFEVTNDYIRKEKQKYQEKREPEII